MRRRVVLWDVMSTLVRDPFYDDIPRFFGMTLAELIEAKHDATWPRFERGHIDEHELARTFFSDGRAFDLPGLKDAMRDGYAWLPGIEPLLRTLSAAGVEMHTLSNYPAWFRMIEQRLGVGRFVRWTFVSCKTGLRKPDARVFVHATRALGVVPGDAVFVDDRADNCDAARAAGLAAVRFQDADQVRAELEGLGLPSRVFR